MSEEHLKIFLAETSQEWYVEENVIILANSEAEAKKVIEREIRLEPYDDWTSSQITRVKNINHSSLMNSANDSEIVFLASPKNDYGFCRVNFDQFMSLVDPDDLEKLRIAEIEKDNGQMEFNLN
jgi:hypothetical protein